jgi:hypothetical protein
LLSAGTAAGNTTYWNGSTWVLNSSNLYNNGGNIGIGTTSPGARLHVVEAAPSGMQALNASTRLAIDAASGGFMEFRSTNDNNTSEGILFTDNNLGGYVTFRNAPEDRLHIGGYSGIGFEVGSENTVGGKTERARISSNGNFGIGNTAPAYKLHIGVGNGDGILIGNYNDQLGWNGSGTAPETAIRFAGYRDVVGNFTGAKIAAVRTNLCCSGLSQGTDISFSIQEGTASGAGDVNLVERMRIVAGGVKFNNLAGSGNRTVYADDNGVLNSYSTKDVAYVQDRTDRVTDASNVGWRVIGASTNDLAVKAGDVITINMSTKFRWTGGSGGDHPYFGIYIQGCTTASVTDWYLYGGADDFPRNQSQEISENFVYVSPCTGNLNFSLYMDSNSAADDNAGTHDTVIIATRH